MNYRITTTVPTKTEADHFARLLASGTGYQVDVEEIDAPLEPTVIDVVVPVETAIRAAVAAETAAPTGAIPSGETDDSNLADVPAQTPEIDQQADVADIPAADPTEQTPTAETSAEPAA